MPVGVVTAALQELTPREQRDADPRSRHRGVARLRHHARGRLHRIVGGPPSIRRRRARRSAARSSSQHTRSPRAVRQSASAASPSVRSTPPECASLTSGYFDDMLHADPAIRRRKHEFCERVMDAAVVTRRRRCLWLVEEINRSRWNRTSSSSSVRSFPYFEQARTVGCSTESSSVGCRDGRQETTSTTTSPTRPRCGSLSHRICERHGVGDQFRIHCGPSHAILMGQDTKSVFQYLHDEGYDFLIAGLHVKGQVINRGA